MWLGFAITLLPCVSPERVSCIDIKIRSRVPVTFDSKFMRKQWQLLFDIQSSVYSSLDVFFFVRDIFINGFIREEP